MQTKLGHVVEEPTAESHGKTTSSISTPSNRGASTIFKPAETTTQTEINLEYGRFCNN